MISLKEGLGLSALETCMPRDVSPTFWDVFHSNSTHMREVHQWFPNAETPKKIPHPVYMRSVSREGLVLALYLNLLAEQLDNVSITFDSSIKVLTTNEDGTLSASFEKKDGYTVETVNVTAVFGCDGKHSFVRSSLQGDFDENGISHGPHWGAVKHVREAVSGRRVLEVPYGYGGWETDCHQVLKTACEDEYVIVSTYGAEKVFRGMLVMTADFVGKHPLILSTDKDDGPELAKQLREVFGSTQDETFSDERVTRMLEETMPPRGYSEWFRVEHFFSRGKQPIVLVGDSAHSLIPSRGLGCNAALQGVEAMMEAISKVCPEVGGKRWAESTEKMLEVFRVYEEIHMERSKKQHWDSSQLCRSGACDSAEAEAKRIELYIRGQENSI